MNAQRFAMTSFQKGRGANEPRARLVGNDRAGTAARRFEGSLNMSRSATRARGPEFGPTTNSGPIEDLNLAERFSAVIIELPVKQVAKIAEVSTETVKGWRKARQVPQAEHLFRLARKIPSVRAFLYAEIDPSLNSPRAMQALFTGLQHVAGQPGPDGEAARSLLRGAVKGGDQ